MTKSVPIAPVLAHIEMLKMSLGELSTRSGVPQSTLGMISRRNHVSESTAARILAVRKPVPHPTVITTEGRVSCGCGFRSQPFSTLGLAKGRERKHQETGQ